MSLELKKLAEELNISTSFTYGCGNVTTVEVSDEMLKFFIKNFGYDANDEKDVKRSLERIAKKIEHIYGVFENTPYMHEDARILICKTLDKTLSEVSDLTDLQRKKVEHRAQKVTVSNWLGTYQNTLDEIKTVLSDMGESDIEIDVTTLEPNETIEWFLKSK
jgi:hypothetical protein